MARDFKIHDPTSNLLKLRSLRKISFLPLRWNDMVMMWKWKIHLFSPAELLFLTAVMMAKQTWEKFYYRKFPPFKDTTFTMSIAADEQWMTMRLGYRAWKEWEVGGCLLVVDVKEHLRHSRRAFFIFVSARTHQWWHRESLPQEVLFVSTWSAFCSTTLSRTNVLVPRILLYI